MEQIKKRFEQLLIYALKNQVSDIHFHMEQETVTIQLRFPTRMEHMESKPTDYAVCQYLAYLADLDLTDRVRPQSGAFSYPFYGRTLYFRLALLYSLNAASLVLRILYQKVIQQELSRKEEQNALFHDAIGKSMGLIVFSGPTGSGKTSSAYALLSKLKGCQIYTIEDPIEMPLRNAVQLQVNPSQNITYETGIKQLMRHDPDVLFIGEIRDEMEAHMAVRAALTGHLVVTTIHAKSCTGAIARLADLKVNMTDFYETVLLLSNQRLVTSENGKERYCEYELMDETKIAAYRFTQSHRQ